MSQIKNLGNVKIRNIYSCFNNADDFFRCSTNDLKRIEGIDSVISDEVIKNIRDKDNLFREFDHVYSAALRQNAGMITLFDDNYPDNLRKIFDAPVIIYYKGKLSPMDKYSLAIVGTRNPTEYGKYNCEKFTEQLTDLNIPVVSGFARGIDTIVHKTCLKKQKLNYAVFGCGVDVIYPFENRKVYDEITSHGALISEFAMGAKPDKVNFPRRNRIISGISIGTLVIESGIKGGALLTAEIAVDQNREVFALPGYINSKQSEGTNELIKKGQAKLVTNVEDILNELEVKLKPVLKNDKYKKTEIDTDSLNDFEKKIFYALDYEPMHIDKINELTQLSVSDCLVNLLSLEFKNLVRQIPGKNFIRN